MTLRLTFVALLLVFCGSLRVLAAGRPMTVDDLLAVKAVSDPQVSPDGALVVYVVSEIDRESQKTNSDLWLAPVAGGEPKRLTTAPGSDSHPRWGPDGSRIAFVSDRSGSSQVWLLPIDGGEARQLTDLPIDLSGPIWSPTGDRLVALGRVFPGSTPEETSERLKEREASKSNVKTFDRLMIRHWDTWEDGRHRHPFVIDAETGEARDLTPDLEANVPPTPFGGSSDYAISPDGARLVFTAEPIENHPWSTNTDLWSVPLDGGERANLTEDNRAADAQPAFSPDGRFLAYLRQDRPGFEADQWVLHIQPLDDPAAEPIPLTRGLDRPVSSFRWDRDGASLLAVVEDAGASAIYTLSALGRMNPTPFLNGGGSYGSPSRAAHQAVVATRSSADRPTEIWIDPPGADNLKPLTHHNDELIAELDLNPAESFTFSGADGDEVQGFLIRPPGFDPDTRYPVLFLIHGGPQGAWHDSWHPRWNLGLFAAPGYACVAINPRGSTGFGQKFTDQISQDWSGRVYEDLMNGLDHALATYPFLDAERVAAAGGSYGGYMVNWIAGQTDRFRALISHAGVFDLKSMYFTTEELWFPEWEFGGPPWENPQAYEAHSPSNFVENFSTPTLVIHGALDFRVPDAQGLGMFTALQRRGVPSRYVFFPDEGHWIAKPANRVTWWNEFHGWLETHLKED